MDYLKEVKEAAGEVLRELGKGYEEKVYEEALAHELRIRKIPYERQRNFEIIYKGYKVGEGRTDLILNPLWYKKGGEEIVLELKKGGKISDAHRRQAQVYMISLNIKRGAVLSFGDEIILEEVKRPKTTMNLYVAKGKKSNKPIFTLLRKSAEEVFKYFGVEFLYRDKSGVDIFTNAIGVELRLNGIEYSNATFPICYKNHQVSDFSFDFVFPNGEIANVYSYKNKEEIEEKLEEFKTYLKLFNLKKGYLICFPLIEEDKVLIEAVENITK